MTGVRTHVARIYDACEAMQYRGDYRVCVWADRWYGTCPGCGQPVPTEIESAPSALNMGQVESRDQRHGCGEWLSVESVELPADATDEQIAEARAELTAVAEQYRREARDEIRRQLAADLAEFLAGGDVEPTGSDEHPGIYRPTYGTHDGRWVAWAYGPSGDGDDIVTVIAAREAHRHLAAEVERIADQCDSDAAAHRAHVRRMGSDAADIMRATGWAEAHEVDARRIRAALGSTPDTGTPADLPRCPDCGATHDPAQCAREHGSGASCDCCHAIHAATPRTTED